MILGPSVTTFTLIHVLISLVGIATGLVALAAMIAGKDLGGWTATFLATKGNELPFAVAQGGLLLAMVAAGWFAVRNFRPGVAAAATARPATA